MPKCIVCNRRCWAKLETCDKRLYHFCYDCILRVRIIFGIPQNEKTAKKDTRSHKLNKQGGDNYGKH